MKSQRSDTEKKNFIEEGERKSIDGIIRQNAQYKVETMKYKTVVSYCLKYRKKKYINPTVSVTSNGKKMILSLCFMQS